MTPGGEQSVVSHAETSDCPLPDVCFCLKAPFISMNCITVHLFLPQCAPFSAVERGEGSPRRRFCYFGRQLRWLFWNNYNKNTIKPRIEYDYIHILKVLGGLGASFKKPPGVPRALPEL